MLATLVDPTIMPLVDVLIDTFRDTTQDFCAAAHPRAEGLGAIPQAGFGSVLNDSGKNIGALLAFRVGDDQNPAISDHAVNRAGFVVDVNPLWNAGFVIKAISLWQPQIMFHFRRMGKIAQPQLIVKAVHIVGGGHVFVGTSPAWNVFNDARMLEIGVVPSEELIHSAGTAK